MVKRTVAGVIMGGILFLVLWLTYYSHLVFDGVVLVIGGLATWEIYSALKLPSAENPEKKCFQVNLIPLAIGWFLSYPMSLYFGYMGIFFDFIITLLVAFMFFIFNPNQKFSDFSATVFGAVYPMTLLSILFVLQSKFGMIPVILAIAIGTISDLFAYLIGYLFGKKKIFPKISPKKTYAGCIAGLFGGAIGGIIVYLIFELGGFPTNISFTFSSILPSMGATIGVYCAIGFVIAVFSEIGDLAASRVKREVGIKDYGKALGSHGGFLDRIDSILFTTVCVAVIMEIIAWVCL